MTPADSARIRRRLLALAIILAGALPLLIQLYGCASVDMLAAGGTEEWDPLPVRAPAEFVIPVHIGDPDELRERCYYRGASVLFGCAKFITNEICVIYHAQPTMTPDVERHERKHCAGFVHRQKRSFE